MTSSAHALNTERAGTVCNTGTAGTAGLSSPPIRDPKVQRCHTFASRDIAGQAGSSSTLPQCASSSKSDLILPLPLPTDPPASEQPLHRLPYRHFASLEAQDPVTHLPESPQARAAPQGEKVDRQELVEVLARTTSQSQPLTHRPTPPERCR